MSTTTIAHPCIGSSVYACSATACSDSWWDFMAGAARPTGYDGVPCAGTRVEAGSLQQKGDELAELEDYAGADLCLGEHLHGVRVRLMLSSALWLLSHPASGLKHRPSSQGILHTSHFIMMISLAAD